MTISYLRAEPLLPNSRFSVYIYHCKENRMKEAKRESGWVLGKKISKQPKDIIVDPWTTWAWTVQVHLYVDFFNSKHSSNMQPAVVWIHRSRSTQIWRANCKLYVNFWLYEVSVPLTPVLFKGQPYIPTSILWGFHFLHILTNTSIFLIIAILVGMKYISLWFCICLLANDVEHLFFFINYLFVYFLAMLGLSCGTWSL